MNSVGNTVHTSTVANMVMTTNFDVSSEKTYSSRDLYGAILSKNIQNNEQ